MKIAINERFATQGLSGVQRYASEVVRVLRSETPQSERTTIELVAPSGSIWTSRGTGHVWDQIVLPLRARDSVLLCLGNVGPVIARRQVVVLHDAAIYDVPESYRPTYRLAHRIVHRGLVARGARLATVSEFSRERLATALGLPSESIPVTGVGSDHIERPRPEPSILQKLALRPAGYVLAVASRVAHKNLPLLEAATPALAERGLRTVLVGEIAPRFAADQSRLASLIATGPLNDGQLRALYEHAFAFVFPSYYEGFGLPPLEAMRLGCPVLIARARPLVEHCGEAALSFSPTDPAELIAQVDRLNASSALRAELGSRGRRLAARWRWSDVAANILKLLADCVRGEPAPASRCGSVHRSEIEIRG